MSLYESLRRIKRKIIKSFRKPYLKSYSQSGEDVIVKCLLDSLGIKKPTYLDIGANDPLYISNTALFYKRGSNGINIEPNPKLYRNIKRKRKRDINLNVGVGSARNELQFYVMNSDTMSTFSKESADELVTKFGFKIESVISVPVITISDIIEKYCDGIFPDFLTIDTEGLDFEILKNIDYSTNYPKVICAETREYGEGLEAGKREKDIEDLLVSNGYKVYANTYVNTIFYKK